MTGYKLTIEQKQQIEGKEFAENQFFNPVQDVNGDWFIFDGEVINCVNSEFEFIKLLQPEKFIPYENTMDQI